MATGEVEIVLVRERGGIGRENFPQPIAIRVQNQQ
jgi:hypothetical protein